MTEKVEVEFVGGAKSVEDAANKCDAEFKRLQASAARTTGEIAKGFDATGTKIGQVGKSVASTAQQLEKAGASAKKIGGGIAGAAAEAKGLAEKTRGAVSQISSYLGAAGLVVTAVVGIGAAVYEWASAQEDVNKQLDESLEKLAKRSEIFAAEMDAEERHRAEDRKYASEKKARDEAAHQETLSTIQSTMEQEIALAELYKSDERAINDIKLEGLGYQRDELVLAGKNTQEIDNQIALLEEKNSIMDSNNRRTLEPKKGGKDPRAGWKKAQNDQREAGSEIMGEGIAAVAAENDRLLTEQKKANVISLEAFRLEQEAQRLGETTGNEAALHRNRMQAIEAEYQLQDQILRAQQEANDPNVDNRQLAHDREMLALQADLDMRRAVADESQRIADQQQANFERQMATAASAASAIESVHANLSSKLGDFRSEQQAQDDAAFQHWEQQQNARTSAQSAQLDKQIAQARGNASKTAELERQKAAIERRNQQTIEKARRKHAEENEKTDRRQKGIAMLLEGGLAVVRAATAYPNIPEMIAMAAAAALAFAFGAATLAGGTPGAGGGVGAGGSNAPSGSDRQFDEAAKTPGSAAADKQPGPKKDDGSSGKGGSVVNIGQINTFGKMTQDEAEQAGLAINKAYRTSEKAGNG